MHLESALARLTQGTTDEAGTPQTWLRHRSLARVGLRPRHRSWNPELVPAVCPSGYLPTYSKHHLFPLSVAIPQELLQAMAFCFVVGTHGKPLSLPRSTSPHRDRRLPWTTPRVRERHRAVPQLYVAVAFPRPWVNGLADTLYRWKLVCSGDHRMVGAIQCS